MAIPIFQNPFPYEIAVPSYNGSSVILASKKFVQGNYYSDLANEGTLVLWEGTTPSSADIHYTYPEVNGYYQGTTEITRIIAGTGLTGGGTSGEVTVGIAVEGVTETRIAPNAITASKVASGQLVKSFNSLTDNITLEVGANLTLTTEGNTITIEAPTGGITSVTATLPLILTLGEGNASIEGSIEITPTTSGGAVALQTFDNGIVYQEGYSGLFGLHLVSDIDHLIDPVQQFVFGIYNSSDYSNLLGIRTDGKLNSSNDISTSGTFHSDSIQLYESIILDTNGEMTIEGNWVNLSGNPNVTSFIDVPLLIQDELFLGPSTRSSGGTGHISGTLYDENLTPLIHLTQHSSTLPLLKLSSSQVYPGISSTSILDYTDDDGVSLVSIHDDGVITAKTIEADVVSATSISTDSLSINVKIVTTDAYDLALISGTTFACDTSAGAITFQLPLIDPLTMTSGTVVYTFTKTAHSSNNVLIGPTGGQTINGETSLLIQDTWVPVRIVAVIGEGPSPVTFWMSV